MAYTKTKKAEIQKVVEELVYAGLDKSPVLLDSYSDKLEITKKKLVCFINEFKVSIAHELEPEEMHIFFRGSIRKLLDIIHMTRCSPGEKNRAITVLNSTIDNYLNTLKPDEADTSRDTAILHELLKELYSTPEGLKMVQRVEKSIE